MKGAIAIKAGDGWDRAEELFNRAIAQRLVPGVVAAAGVGEHVAWRYVGGQALVNGGTPRPMTTDTWFDVASLTKVMATLPALLVLAGQGQLTLGDSVRRFFPEWEVRWDEVTLLRLLTHTAGLASHRNYYESLAGCDAFLTAIQTEAWDGVPGLQAVYSDLGYILLGAVTERAAQQPLDIFADQEVFSPLAMHAQYRPAEGIKVLSAATEVIDGTALTGVVHDENARAMGGVAGHAGLFATLEDVIKYAVSWTGESASLFSETVRHAAMRDYGRGPHGHRGLGWSLRGDCYDVGGDFWPLSGGGHTGFTGTSLQIDLASGLWAVLLTNRVHFGRGASINPLRRAFHNIVAQCLG